MGGSPIQFLSLIWFLPASPTVWVGLHGKMENGRIPGPGGGIRCRGAAASLMSWLLIAA